MSSILQEIDINFDKFSQNWKFDLEKTRLTLESENETFKKSYRRIVSLNSWRYLILERKISKESLSFFIEAQNDALVSHTLAQFGSWRSALKALRSCIENTIATLYYKDHPIELQLWHLGKHRLGFTESIKYLKEHPMFLNLSDSKTGIESIIKEYGTLSRAVHGSALSFRMTADTSVVKLWSSESGQLGSWRTREQHTLSALNLILLTMYRDELGGAKLPNLRQAISLVIPASKYTLIKDNLGVTLSN
jgi:hypothetical protein